MVGEIIVWALLYYAWGELGGFANSIYFSLASFTTVGASELVLSPAHRLAGALEAGVGMLMVGWSTALLFEVIQTTRGTRKPKIR
jgi:voltage-gated potassium channel Kch